MAQEKLSIRDAVDMALRNFPAIKAKQAYLQASQAGIQTARKEALPNFVVSLQQDYGTVNGQNGPLYGLGGYGVASSGLPLPEQNWNAAFGALYLANVNWDVFTFGRNKQKVRTAGSIAERDRADYSQEIFQHEIRVAGAYLNLVAAQRLRISQEQNLNRADTFRNVVIRKAINGLVAGVDSSQANAEFSNARSALILARDAEQERANQLAFLVGIQSQDFILDTTLFSSKPDVNRQPAAATEHPTLQFYQTRINQNEEQTKLVNAAKFPAISVFGIYQTRGSGFDFGYSADQKAYTQSYLDGVKPTRSNYLFGVGMFWNITSLTRVKQQVNSQQYISAALQQEYNVAASQLNAQQALAANKLSNALANYQEAPIQVKAAADAYLQKSVLYHNGLATIIDVTQALYTLNRAETTRDVATSNVWQALLLKAAATGDFNLFLNQLQ
ncbi:RND-type efflux pump outer membrane protein [Flavihumibacter petaseus NBRC 106054]|uniref:RND-type efflux pump outer membrane protein n=2 Tax=Flavihumibacter TaxID=1004301 RepID=A0A0E9N712_9BACT|nr:RND-type efflux pump outer membrane protein [Flavihumibacter petaseus NBRC 106054]